MLAMQIKANKPPRKMEPTEISMKHSENELTLQTACGDCPISSDRVNKVKNPSQK
jgi:hypothetical protein